MPDTLTPVHPWLAQFPAHRQPIVRSWFAAVRLPGQSAEDLLHRVAETVSRRLDWQPVARDTQQLCEQTWPRLPYHQ